MDTDRYAYEIEMKIWLMKAKLIFVGHVELKSKLLENPLNIRNVQLSYVVGKIWKKL